MKFVSIIFSIVTLLPMVMQGEGKFLLLKLQGAEKGSIQFPGALKSSVDTGAYR